MVRAGEIHSTFQCLINTKQSSRCCFVAFASLTRHPLCINIQRIKIVQVSYAMFCCLMLYCTILLLASAASISVAQDACIYRSGAMLVNSVVVVKQTIHIITSVPHVTTFQVNSDLTITVDNAPTSLDFLTTYFSRSTTIETVNRSVSPVQKALNPILKYLTQSGSIRYISV